MREEQRLPWQNHLDLQKFLVEIHDTKGQLGTDVKLIYWDPKSEELAMTMLNVAAMAIDLSPNKDIGREIANMDLAPIQLLTKTRFNRPDNWLVARFTNPDVKEEQEMMPQEEGWTDKLVNRIKGNKKPRVVEEDD